MLTSLALADTRIHKAANRGDIAQVKKLLQRNPDVDERDSFGGTALHAAMFQDNIEVAKILIDYGYDVNVIGPSNGYTPLHDAVWAKNLEAVKLLIEKGADTEIRGKDGYIPLEKARREDESEIAEYLEGIK